MSKSRPRAQRGEFPPQVACTFAFCVAPDKDNVKTGVWKGTMIGVAVACNGESHRLLGAIVKNADNIRDHVMQAHAFCSALKQEHAVTDGVISALFLNETQVPIHADLRNEFDAGDECIKMDASNLTVFFTGPPVGIIQDMAMRNLRKHDFAFDVSETPTCHGSATLDFLESIANLFHPDTFRQAHIEYDIREMEFVHGSHHSSNTSATPILSGCPYPIIFEKNRCTTTLAEHFRELKVQHSVPLIDVPLVCLTITRASELYELSSTSES